MTDSKKIFSKRTGNQIPTNIREANPDIHSNQFESIEIREDPEIRILQREVREIELQISVASEEKTEIEKLVYSFNLRYSKELGGIVIQILKLKRDCDRQIAMHSFR